MDETQNLVETAAALADPSRAEDDAVPYIVVPEGYQRLDLEKTLQNPLRKRGTVQVDDAESFIAYYTQHAESAQVFGRISPTQFVAILNGHGAGPGWGDHRVVYVCPHSREWAAWTGRDGLGRMTNQLGFAQFIEANLADIVSTEPGEPSGTDMLTVATQFRAQKKVNFASGQRLDNGTVQFTYEEEVQGSAGAKGQIRVPESFFIGIPVYEGGDRYKLEARLRYKVAEGGLTMGFELVRPHLTEEKAFEAIWAEITAGVGPILRGEAPKALA